MVPGVTRCGEHFDYGTLTFLVQDDIGGLEVKSRGEGWIRARPIPGTILVREKWHERMDFMIFFLVKGKKYLQCFF